jgi:hypothetical protein
MLNFAIDILKPTRRHALMHALRNAAAGIPSQPSSEMCLASWNTSSAGGTVEISVSVKLDDGNYYIVISDRSGNHYTVTAKVSSTGLECNIKESTDKYIRLTCNRRDDQILRYEIYLNGTLVTSTYAPEQTFDKAGLYTIYVQDIYGNEFSQEYIFNRNYPTVTWKYLGSDGKYHEYDPNGTSANGFVLTWVSDNQYKISTAVKTRFSFS